VPSPVEAKERRPTDKFSQNRIKVAIQKSFIQIFERSFTQVHFDAHCLELPFQHERNSLKFSWD
jgi:hypothetical protein